MIIFIQCYYLVSIFIRCYYQCSFFCQKKNKAGLQPVSTTYGTGQLSCFQMKITKKCLKSTNCALIAALPSLCLQAISKLLRIYQIKLKTVNLLIQLDTFIVLVDRYEAYIVSFLSRHDQKF